ncbi:MAG: hypothetical protein JXN61_11520 [Sedimentisphaerales bacterium]|nr:hypothetical protein [Sedimentisphaerales bacterium]
MKRAMRILVLTAFFVNLTVLGSAPGPLFREPLNDLFGRPHPALDAIDAVKVVVSPTGDRSITDAVFWKELGEKVEQRLANAGIKIPDPTQAGRTSAPFDTAEFSVCSDVRRFDADQMLLTVRTGLARPVYVAMREPGSKQLKPGPMVMAPVWTETSAIMPATTQHVREDITRETLQQADAFIAAWVASNRSERKGLSGDATIIEKIPTEQPADTAQAEYKYVSSKNSIIFHTPNCRAAKRISPENLLCFKTRQEALNAGKRPCKLCTP